MKTKTFSELVEYLKQQSPVDEAIANDYISQKDDDDEVKDIKPRSKGEKEFKDKHKVDKKNHPVADDDQFSGGTKPSGDKKSKGEPTIKQGSSDAKGTPDGSKARDTSKAAGKKFGDLAAVRQGSSKIKESVEFVSEHAFHDIQKIAKSKRDGKVKFGNGRTESIDHDTAKALVDAHSKLNAKNKKTFESTASKSFEGMMKMMDFAMGGGRM